MTDRITFDISPIHMAELVALNQPGAGQTMDFGLFDKGIVIHESKSAAELVTEWWDRVGPEYGIVGNTAKHRGDHTFDGVPL